MRRIAGLAMAAVLAGCSAQEAQSADAVAIDLTAAICAVAVDSPVGQPYVDIVCTVASSVEQGIGALVAGDGGANALTNATPTLKTVRIRMPAGQSTAFLAAHAKK